MKQGECFKINSIEELKKAYYMFEDRWFYSLHSLETEVNLFNHYGYRHIKYTDPFGIYLTDSYNINNYTEIESPLKNINNLNKLI